jgi:hypothetical protein
MDKLNFTNTASKRNLLLEKDKNKQRLSNNEDECVAFGEVNTKKT